MAWSPKGDLLATPSGDTTVRIWNVSDGSSSVLDGHSDTVYTVAWSPKGDALISGSADDSVMRWDLATGQGAVTRIGGWVNVSAWHPVHGPFVGTEDGRLVWVRENVARPLRVETGGGSITALAFNHDTSQLLIGTGAGFVRALPFRYPNDLPTIYGFRAHHTFVMSLAYVPQWARLISASLDKTIAIWAWHGDPAQGEAPAEIGRSSETQYVIAVGSPSYKAKYDAVVGNPVVEAEIRLINTRARKKELTETIIPILYAGDSRAAFPPMLEDHVYLDFRDAKTYFAGLLDIILKVHGLPFSDPAIISVRESIQETSSRSGPQA